MHTAAWNTEVDLRDKVVAVVGSGSSAIQVVPSIQPSKSSQARSLMTCLKMAKTDVKKLLNFVRSPVWLTPGFSAKNAGPGGSNFKCKRADLHLATRDP